MMSCVIISALSAIVFLKTLQQVWLYGPYENIFESISPLHHCYAVLILILALVLNQVFGARGGNVESKWIVSIYGLLQLVFAILIATQWACLYKEFKAYRMSQLLDQNEIANFMTYIHQNDFKFLLGGIGSLGTTVGSDQESFSSCPSGKYKDRLSASNIYELKCQQRDLIRMKWDKDSSEKTQSTSFGENENLYACLNIECQEQFKGWIEGLVQSYLLLTGLLFFACLFSSFLACKLSSLYTDNH